jgi:beta-glucosidase
MPKPKKLSKPVAITVYAVAVVLAVGLVVANIYVSRYSDLISGYFGQATQRVEAAEGGADANYYPSDFASDAERTAYLEDVARRITAGGMTLLANNGALPLAANARVTVFGQDAVDPIYGGGGAGSIDVTKAVDLKEGLTQAGLTLNPVLWDFYETGPGASYRKTTPDVYGQGAFAVNEVPRDGYTDDVIASFADYSDAAVIVVGRAGGESGDLSIVPDESGYTYLQLDDNERAMIALACEHFKNVVVLLNTATPVELGPLSDYDVDAVLWIGPLGQTGALAVGQALTGAVNPSGATVDTYAYDSLSAPSAQNMAAAYFTNQTNEAMTYGYVVYAESIYVGYYYYETRYEDVVLGNETKANYNYATQVQYPFGYGLSYTTFDWSGFAVSKADDTYTVSVAVTNTGSVAGRDVVEVYLQQPYTDYDRENGVEKPSVQLAGYAKTSELAPGASETVTIEVPGELFRAYDAAGYGTYIVDAGDYYLTAAEDAHAAINNILAAKGYTTADGMTADGDDGFVHQVTVGTLDAETYATAATGTAIVNQFDDVDIRYYDAGFTYLTRSDWKGTWPTLYQNGFWTLSDQILEDLKISFETNADDVAPNYGVISETYGELSAAMLIGEDYDSPAYDALLDQMTLAEIDTLVRVGGYSTSIVESIQLPATVDRDGPAGISGTLVGGYSGMGYPPAVVLASSWDDELAEEFGRAIGEDSIALSTAGWYAPSMDIHRSPYSGRNFEYYSEDGFISGKMGAAVCRGAVSKGVIVFIKHYALNDQEGNRYGGTMFADEQSVRQIYLTPFELSVREGGANGIMVGMNRVGARYAGGHYGLMTATLRDEWGFTGIAITDQASFSLFAYADLREGLEAGTDLWLNTDAALWALSEADMTPTVQLNMRRAAHNIVYTVINSNAMNGLAADSRLVAITPTWKKLFYGGEVLIGLIILAGVVLVTRKLVTQSRPPAIAIEPAAKA